jgi:uncharacterized coiled-coil protein SlyX
MADVSFFSPYAVGGATRPDSFTNLDPLMRSRLMEMLMAAKEELGPDALRITSAYRSPELQAQLYEDALKKYGDPSVARQWVAPAGRSQHNFGTAVDFANLQGQLLHDPNSPQAKWLKENAARFGLSVPLANEPWQVELAGARDGNITNSQQMRLSTKDAPMTPNQPRTLWERLTSRNENTGLNPLETFAAALDPLIMPDMRGGQAIRQTGAQRAAFAKEENTKNATLNELRKRAMNGDKIAQRYYEGINSGALDTKTGFSGYLNEIGQMAQLDKRLSADASSNAKGVQQGELLPDGSGYVYLSRDGKPVVTTVGGETLTGQAASDFVSKSRANYISEQNELYKNRELGRGEGKLPTAQQIVQSQKEGALKVSFIDDLNKNRANIQSTIDNYQLALDALDQKAPTGRVAKMLPNITATAQMIETAKQRLGLDVIGSVTFGALSQGELDLAMDTGLPSDSLGPTELRKWIEDRMAAQKKTLAALNETALYFSDPNTTFNSYYSDFLGIQPKGGKTPQDNNANPLGL